jgi:hypothetical protein
MKKAMYPRNIEVTEDIIKTSAGLMERISAQGKGEPTIMLGKYFGHKPVIGKTAEGEPALQNSAPHCCLVAVKTDDNNVRVGWAKRHSVNEDGKPTKKDILNTAIVRALADTVSIESKNFASMASGAGIPRAVARELGPFVERAGRYFKGCKLANVG